MRKLIIILAVLLGSIVNAQSVDTLANVEIQIKDTVITSYCLSSLDTSYHGTEKYHTVRLIASKLEPELSDYIAIVNKDYVVANDTLKLVLFQGKSQTYPLDIERFIIQTKLNVYFPTMNELSQTMQYKLYLFGEKIKENIRKGYYYEN
jgi:hypothetical protein